MWPMKRGTSSGSTMPFSISSALPMMPCSGVLSSWETLAVNSRRCAARRVSRSVMSKASSTAPMVAPSGVDAADVKLIDTPGTLARAFRCGRRPARAAMACVNVQARGRAVRKSCPTQLVFRRRTSCSGSGVDAQNRALVDQASTSPSGMLCGDVGELVRLLRCSARS